MSRPPSRPRTATAAPPEPSATYDDNVMPELEESLDPEEIVDAVLERRMSLTPAAVRALNTNWRDVVQYDDEGSKKRKRDIEGVLRRASHRELHPNCARVTVDVPMLPSKVFVRINERVYFGAVEVWECEARTILELVHRARLVEGARLADNGNGGALDLDSPLAERARAIQRA